MKVHAIQQLIKKDVPLYYRNDYEALGDIEWADGSRSLLPIAFTVEIKPTGERIIGVTLKEQINYPLLPVIRAIKEKITLLDKNGKL